MRSKLHSLKLVYKSLEDGTVIKRRCLILMKHEENRIFWLKRLWRDEYNPEYFDHFVNAETMSANVIKRTMEKLSKSFCNAILSARRKRVPPCRSDIRLEYVFDAFRDLCLRYLKESRNTRYCITLMYATAYYMLMKNGLQGKYRSLIVDNIVADWDNFTTSEKCRTFGRVKMALTRITESVV
jgi:hypothetical protein